MLLLIEYCSNTCTHLQCSIYFVLCITTVSGILIIFVTLIPNARHPMLRERGRDEGRSDGWMEGGRWGGREGGREGCR